MYTHPQTLWHHSGHEKWSTVTVVLIFWVQGILWGLVFRLSFQRILLILVSLCYQSFMPSLKLYCSTGKPAQCQETTGPPVFSRPRRTHAATLQIRPSSSAWAWPRHMVLGDWHPCRDYRANHSTVPDRNSVPHLHIFCRMPQYFEVGPGACLPSDQAA